MNEKSAQILELVKGLTILELADLVKALEEEFVELVYIYICLVNDAVKFLCAELSRLLAAFEKLMELRS